MPQIINLPQGGGSFSVTTGRNYTEEEQGLFDIEKLINITAHFQIYRALRGTTIMGQTQMEKDVVSVSFSAWMMKCWAALRMTREIAWQELVESCIEGMIEEGLPIDLDANPERANKIAKQIDGALAALVRLGLVSASRVEKDHLHEGVPDGDTSRALKELAELRERRSQELNVEKARLEYRLQQIRGDDVAEKPKLRFKKNAGGA